MGTYRARYVFPVSSEPIEGGYVTVEGKRIVSVGRRALESRVEDLGNVALVPGFVNAHTHLEFSDLAEPLGKPRNSLPDWIRAVVARRRQQQAGDVDLSSLVATAVTTGLEQSRASGAVALGEIATVPWTGDFPQSDLRATLFFEQIGLQIERSDAAHESADQWLRNTADSNEVARGLSPHAPYSARLQLVEALCAASREYSVPVAMHIGESREELQLLRDGTGPFVDLLESLNAWDAAAIPPETRVLDYMKRLATAHRALVIHGNYLAADEMEFLAEHRDSMCVVYCPRTYDYFHDQSYPLSTMLAGGVKMAIGTDSRASNPDLNMLNEFRFLAKRHTDVSPATCLKLVTKRGAAALQHDDLGTLAVGNTADFAIVPLPARSTADPHELLLG